MANERVFAYLKELAEKGSLTATHILNAKTKGWVNEQQAEELMLIALAD